MEWFTRKPSRAIFLQCQYEVSKKCNISDNVDHFKLIKKLHLKCSVKFTKVTQHDPQ